MCKPQFHEQNKVDMMADGSTREYLTKLMPKKSLKEYLTWKNGLLLLIIVDIILFHVIFFSTNRYLDRYDIQEMDLYLGLYVGLDLLAFCGVYMSQKPLVLLHLAFYSGMVISSFAHQDNGFDVFHTCYQIVMFGNLIKYVLLPEAEPEEVSCTDEATECLMNKTPVWDPLHLASEFTTK